MSTQNLSSENLQYIEELYVQYQQNPESLEETWRSFFDGVDFASEKGGISSKELNVYNLIQAYRDYGHFQAHLNPLSQPTPSGDLSLTQFELTDADLGSTFSVGQFIGLENATLKEILEHLQKSYCGTYSVQVSDTVKGVREWFHQKMEEPRKALPKDKKENILKQLIRTETIEKFLHTRFVGMKRFSIEGADSMIPMLENMTTKGCELGVEEFVIGMAHRGRINVLANYMDKGLDVILAQFLGMSENIPDYDGDVKYHLGHSVDKETASGQCHISLAFNPSHLEAVNPVVLGMTRAKQRFYEDTNERKKVVPVLIHGDAAFAGQGVVSESLQLMHLKGYTIGGAIHIIVDNQVGFTADPEATRSSPYSSDVAKSQQIPVIHVNGDDVEACVRAMEMAIQFRQEYKQDIVINLMCYRRYGHNEGDEPAFTQPAMYEAIKKHTTPCELYGKKLVQEGSVTQELYDGFYKEKMTNLKGLLEQVKEKTPEFEVQAFGGVWEGLRRSKEEDFLVSPETGASKKIIESVGKALTHIPDGFEIHPKLKKLLTAREKMYKGEQPVDWGMAELLAYGSTIAEGNSVRLSGQDCIRGTFTHRHSCFFDRRTGELYNPLSTVNKEKEFCVYNSSLSEMAVLGFEYGNSISDPHFLTIWEAQFGDFANGAQIIIDQFLASGEQKWMRTSGLVLLLPHGYEGQGPEHSSAKLERFLQLCAQKNMQVCNLTTPAQIFHALRRQVKRDFRLPLVVMSPKSLLRHPEAVSTIDELVNGKFQEILPDIDVDLAKVKKCVFVSGKLYYELKAHRDKEGRKDVALIRLEQLYPLPFAKMSEILELAKSTETVVWAQEEPKNMGAWWYISHPLIELIQKSSLKNCSLQYVGREFRASPATGTNKKHVQEQQAIIEKIFN